MKNLLSFEVSIVLKHKWKIIFLRLFLLPIFLFQKSGSILHCPLVPWELAPNFSFWLSISDTDKVFHFQACLPWYLPNISSLWRLPWDTGSLRRNKSRTSLTWKFLFNFTKNYQMYILPSPCDILQFNVSVLLYI